MKLYLAAALLLAAVDFTVAGGAASGDDQLDVCVDCLEDVDDARDCLRQCNNIDYTTQSGDVVNLLAECLDPDGDFGSIESIDELTRCCGFVGRDCESDLEDVQECLLGCLDTCISDLANDYLDCLTDETGRSNCELSECLDGFLSDDIEEDIELGGSGDIFDLRSIARRIDRIDEEDLEDCDLLEPFVTTVCDIGDDCCDRCQSELGAVVDCLINDLVIPFVAIEANKTIPTCNINAEDCELERGRGGPRGLKEVSPEEAELFNKALGLPKKEKAETTERNPRTDALIKRMSENRKLEKSDTAELIAVCESTLRMEMVAKNVTEATNNYMECIMAAGIVVMSDAEQEKTESAAAGIFKLVSYAFAAMGSMLFL